MEDPVDAVGGVGTGLDDGAIGARPADGHIRGDVEIALWRPRLPLPRYREGVGAGGHAEGDPGEFVGFNNALTQCRLGPPESAVVVTTQPGQGWACTATFAPNSEVLSMVSVAVPVIRSPTARPLTVRVPLKLPLASVVTYAEIGLSFPVAGWDRCRT